MLEYSVHKFEYYLAAAYKLQMTKEVAKAELGAGAIGAAFSKKAARAWAAQVAKLLKTKKTKRKAKPIAELTDPFTGETFKAYVDGEEKS